MVGRAIGRGWTRGGQGTGGRGQGTGDGGQGTERSSLKFFHYGGLERMLQSVWWSLFLEFGSWGSALKLN
jgi:hypothetical protein